MAEEVKGSKSEELLDNDTFSTKQLVALLGEKGYSRTDAKEFIDALFDVIGESLKSGKKVRISNFGVFKPVVREPRTIVNPLDKDKKKITTRPRRSVRLKLAKNLKEIA